MDLMHLKTYLFNNNVHTSHPTLFKKVNDKCKMEGFETKINQAQFVEMYLNEQTLN